MRAPRLSAWFVLATLAAAGAAAAAGYALTAPKRYRATAQILVTPISASDTTFAGLDVLRDTTGKDTAAPTAAALVGSPQVADGVRAQLGLQRSSSSLLDDLSTHVVDRSDVVDVTVEDTSAVSAAQLANAFVDVLIAQRTATFQSRLGSVIRRSAQLLSGGSAGPQAVELARRLAVLRTFQGQPDPTLRRASTATAPESSSGPGVAAVVGVGAGSGLALGLLVVAALALLRRRGEAGPLRRRESAFAARERDLQAKIDELRALDAEPARRAAPQPPEPEAPPAAPVAAPAPGPDGAFNLRELERLVEAHGDRFPERLEEWRSYLFFLRDYAGPDGTLPGTFDSLVHDTFEELLQVGRFP